MPLTRIRELYVAELSELYEAEEEILRMLPLMAARACAPALRQIFEDHYRETRGHIDRLATICHQLDERRRPTAAPAIRGLAEEARLRQAALERGELLDLALIDGARRIEHYEIAAYAAVAGYAERLGHGDAAALLLETLDEERRADSQLETLPASTRLTAA
jgi:Uncharacterized protein conserved in bacteria